MQLISGLVSNNAAKVRMVLAEKGVEYETVEVPWTKENAWEPKPNILKTSNPREQVPVLVDGDLTLWDSTVINEYLEERFPTPALFANDLKTKALIRLWEDEGDDNQAHVGVLIQEVFLAEPGAALSEAGQKAQAALAQFVTRIDSQLGEDDYLCGEFSVADISVFLTLAFGVTLGVQLDSDKVSVWYQRVLDRPAIKAEFEAMMAGVAAL